MRAYGIIPARLESSRLPGKLLLSDTGQPLIQYTWQAARRARLLSEVIVATDSLQIAEVVRGFGCRAEMTGEHPSGTDRVAEVVRRHGDDVDIIVNIQGDEPEIDPSILDTLVQTLAERPSVEMATLATPIVDRRELDDTNCNKVVCAADGRALYFSRATIPFCRGADPDELLKQNSPWLLHLGVYAYRREFLLELSAHPPSRLEQLEKLEQLRALEIGATIQVAVVNQPTVGIDTPEDYARFVRRQQERAA